MHLSQFHYLPLSPSFFSLLIALFVGLLVIMIVLGGDQASADSKECSRLILGGFDHRLAAVLLPDFR